MNRIIAIAGKFERRMENKLWLVILVGGLLSGACMHLLFAATVNPAPIQPIDPNTVVWGEPVYTSVGSDRGTLRFAVYTEMPKGLPEPDLAPGFIYVGIESFQGPEGPVTVITSIAPNSQE